MIDEEIERRVVRDLAGGRSHNETITRLCERTGMQWNDAVRIIEAVEAKHQGKITSRRDRFVYFLGIMITVGGLGMIALFLLFTLNGLNYTLLLLPIPYLGNAALFITGVAMFLGGLKGLYTQRSKRESK